MADFEYYAELGVDTGKAIKGLTDAVSAATHLERALEGLSKGAEKAGKSLVDNADDIGKTVRLYQQLADAVGSYGRAIKNLKGTDLAQGHKQFEQSLKNMRSALGNEELVPQQTDKKRTENQRATLALYKELAGATSTYAKGLQTEAQAVKAVVDAETRRLKVMQEVNQAKRGTDIWGVGKEERDQRKKAQVQMQASREMEAEFERRERSAKRTQRAVVRGEQETQRALASTRYALYEVAASFAAAAAAAAALPVGAARSAIEMEAQFAHVIRTTQASTAATARLKREFMDLSTQIPISFEELSRIGTLGAQMGINIADLEQFTEVVAKFAATTNVTADEAAMSFGRIANMMDDIDPSKFESFGSAISELGTNSVATESEILVVAESIATAGNMAGFSAAEVAGLSTALASLRIRPEMARGAIQRIFAQINQAVAEGNSQLSGYARALNMSEEAAANLWRSDPSRFFQGVARGIGEMDDNIERSLFIRDVLNLRNIRDVEMLSRLANGYDVYAASMDLAQDAYARGDYLDKETGPIFETTAAALEKLSNSFKAFLATMGEDTLSPIKFVADTLNAFLNLAQKVPAPVRAMATAFSGVVAVMFTMRVALALATASTLAFQLAYRNLAASGGLSLRQFANRARETFLGTAAHANTATASINATTAATTRMAGAATSGARAVGGLALSLAGGWIGVAAAGLAVVATGIYSLATAHDRAKQAAKEQAEAFVDAMGGQRELLRALHQDAEEFASGTQSEELGRLNIELAKFEGQAESASDVLTSVLVPGQESHEQSVRGVTRAYEEAYGAIGKHTDALIRKALIEQATSGDNAITADQINSLADYGFDFDEWATQLQVAGKEGADAYITGFIDELSEESAKLHDAMRMGDEAALESATVTAERLNGLRKLRDSTADVNLAMEEGNAQIALAEKLGNPFEEAEEGAGEFGEQMGGVNEKLKTFIDDLFAIVDSEAAVYEAFDRLGKALADNGATFNLTTEEGRANLEALKGTIDAVARDLVFQLEAGQLSGEDAAMQFAGTIDAIMAELEAQGVDTAELMDIIHGDITATFNQAIGVNIDVEPAMSDLEALQQYAWSVFANIDLAQSSLLGAGRRVLAATLDAHRAGGPPAQREARELAAARKERQRAYQEAAAERAKSIFDAQRYNRTQREAGNHARDNADQMKRLREELARANDEGRIFEEIMKEMRTAFSETLDKFNGMQSARDSMESQLHAMRNAAQSARDEVTKLREEAAKLRREAADERIAAEQATIFATVAQRYGDTTRYNQYSNEASNARAAAREKEKLAKAASDEAAELDKNRNSLTGYSEQAIKNREHVRNLQRQMADLILEYAETGATTEEVTRYTEDLRRKFVDQLVQMGYNRADVERLSRVFQHLKSDIERVPREVRIRARADVDEARKKINDLTKGRTVPITFRAAQQRIKAQGDLEVQDIQARKLTMNQLIHGGGLGHLGQYMRSKGGPIPGVPPTNRNIDNILTTGPKGSLFGVQSGEYVVKTNAVQHYGQDFMNAINNMKFSPVVVSAPTVQAPSAGNVDLSPRSVQMLAQLVSTQLSIDGRVVASSTNRNNTNEARRGAN